MDDIPDLLSEIQVPTQDLKSESLQKLLLYSQRIIQSPALWDEVSQTLWSHLQHSLSNFDDQLLCSTCFYAILIHSNSQEYYINNILDLIEKDMEHKIDVVTALMYGIFQSPFLTSNNVNLSVVCPLLESMFHLLVKMGYIYSKFTFIVFKTISSFKKICGTDLQQNILNEENQIKLLNLINHNWENPITGVRDLIKDIFKTLLSTLNENTYSVLLKEIHELYWNKAKYLMLSKVVELNRGGTKRFICINYLTKGLMKSLYKTGLVSAGADLYYAVLKNINSEDEWCEIFLKDVIHISRCPSSIKAIENFNNYWILITLKKFPILFQVILEELEKEPDSHQKLFSTLFIEKQANRLCLLDKDFEGTENQFARKITNGLANIDSQIRLLAFDILCVSLRKSMPTKTEYNLVLNFIKFNVNSDCTVLRISMLNSLTIFFTEIHIFFVNNVRTLEEEQNMYDFFLRFQEIIIRFLNLNGNYQRKITCIKMARLFLTAVYEIPRKRKKQTKESINTIFEQLKAKNMLILMNETNFDMFMTLLNDPAEDIRNNVIDLLLNHFPGNLQNPVVINNLITSAMLKNESKYFYEINCGQSIFTLVVYILLRDEHEEAKFKSAQEMFQFAYNELIAEHNLQRDVVNSIQNGKQLHALISTLYTVLKVSYEKRHDIVISQNEMKSLLDVLGDISKQFAAENETSTSSDFSKINDMVEDMVRKSSYSCDIDADETKLSGFHQIVLNCLWLNVKASCDLASLLIQHEIEGKHHTDVCEKSLDIIVNVLETCRHKGAIEAAGVALGQSIRYLTTLSDTTELAKLPMSLLERKLTTLISEAGKMASITRRGAGLSIMVHRIVANDMKKGKPLFHYFMKTLLEACKKTEYCPNQQECHDLDNEKDLPKAIFIHFLTRIVTDSGLASDTMFYAPELAKLAFNNLINEYWQIRNAALQLYGALVPKLIGQKKQSDTEDETVATVGCDELRTHFPEMWDYMIIKLKTVDENDRLQCHSNLVPILNILANMARRYNFSWDMKKQRETDNILLNSLFLLLDSPIYTVRRLTAKCIFNTSDFTIVYSRIMNIKFFTENSLHGCFTLLKYYKDFFNDTANTNEFHSLKIRFMRILKQDNSSYLCKALFVDLFCEVDLNLDLLKQVIFEANAISHAPGIHLWKNKIINKCITNADWDRIPELLNILMKNSDIEYSCQIILKKIHNEPIGKQKRNSLLKIANILLDLEHKFEMGIIWELLCKISLKVSLDGLVTSDILNYFESNTVSYKLRYMIPFIVRMSAKEEFNENLKIVSDIIYTLTDAATTDIEMRYIATMANNEIGNIFAIVSDSVKITAIKSAIILLQDENDGVRSLSVRFYVSLLKEDKTPHPYLCLIKLLNKNVLNKYLNEESIQTLSSDLEKFITESSKKPDPDELNPFANDAKNIYMEVNVLQMLVKNLKD